MPKVLSKFLVVTEDQLSSRLRVLAEILEKAPSRSLHDQSPKLHTSVLSVLCRAADRIDELEGEAKKTDNLRRALAGFLKDYIPGP